MKPFFVLAIVLAANSISSVTFARTAWPDFMPTLKPSASASPVLAELPPNLAIETPAADIPVEKALWSGQWRGWSGKVKDGDVRLAVVKVTPTGATIYYAFASMSIPPFTTKVEATFVGDELQATIEGGAKIAFRMRDSGDIEFYWNQYRYSAAGILSREK